MAGQIALLSHQAAGLVPCKPTGYKLKEVAVCVLLSLAAIAALRFLYEEYKRRSPLNKFPKDVQRVLKQTGYAVYPHDGHPEWSEMQERKTPILVGTKKGIPYCAFASLRKSEVSSSCTEVYQRAIFVFFGKHCREIQGEEHYSKIIPQQFKAIADRKKVPDIDNKGEATSTIYSIASERDAGSFKRFADLAKGLVVPGTDGEQVKWQLADFRRS